MQSVLAIPFSVSPVVEAAGDVAPSTDGTFFQSFEDSAPGKRDAEVDASFSEIGVAQATMVPFALLPAGAALQGDSSLAGWIEAVGESSGAAIRSADTLAVSPAGPASAGEAPEAEFGVPGASEVPVASPKTGGATVLLPGLRAGMDEVFSANAVNAAGIPTIAVARLEPSRSEASGEAASAARQPHSDRSGTADVTADPVGIPEKSDTASGSSGYVLPRAGPELSAQSNGGSHAVRFLNGMENSAVSSPAPPDAAMVEGAVSLRSAGFGLEPLVFPTMTLPAIAGSVVSGLSQLAGDRPEAGAESIPTTGVSSSEDGGGAASFETPRQTSAATSWSADRGSVAVLAPDMAVGPGFPEGAGSTEVTAPQPLPSVRAAGFWEQLLTGLSTGLPGDPALVGPDAHPGRGTENEVETATDREAANHPETTAPLAASDRAAASLALFAKTLTLKEDAASDTDMDDQLTVGSAALPSLGTPGQALPQVSSPGAAQLPVPQIAAQISAALTQSADGATELALSPEELGKVRLRLERDAKHPERMVVHITFERPETLDLFRRHAGELAEALRDAGYPGADIGFGHEEGGAGTPDRSVPSVTADYGLALPVSQTPETLAPRLTAGASLDLRL